jgi:ribosomal protein S18 acetylase RimI-like enzyme
MTAVAPLSAALLETATERVSQAFAADPMFAWVMPDPATRLAKLRRLNRVALVYGQTYGRVTQAHDAQAIAIWMPPGHTIGLGGLVRSGILATPFQIGWGAFSRFMAANETMEKLHKRHVPEPHWYLMLVGITPARQGQGIGSALVAEGLAQAGRQPCPAYLETSNERNLAFYQRFGFEVVEQTTLGKDGPPAWAMRRTAAAGAHPLPG